MRLSLRLRLTLKLAQRIRCFIQLCPCALLCSFCLRLRPHPNREGSRLCFLPLTGYNLRIVNYIKGRGVALHNLEQLIDCMLCLTVPVIVKGSRVPRSLPLLRTTTASRSSLGPQPPRYQTRLYAAKIPWAVPDERARQLRNNVRMVPLWKVR